MTEKQLPTQIVDITTWKGEEESRIFPIGSREKILLYCPNPAPFDFLKAGDRYLYKQSNKKCPEQFWIEILCYHIGKKLGIGVPKTYAAIDSRDGTCGALIKWFLKEKTTPATNETISEKSVAGGDLLQGYIPDFDHKKGKKHNLQTIIQIFTKQYPELNWIIPVAQTLLFDVLIGNTDRHQANWEIITNFSGTNRFSPIFDNGTSMGHEIKATEFNKYSEHDIQRYINKGKHHVRWSLDEPEKKHISLLKRYLIAYPETRSTLQVCLEKAQIKDFKEILEYLTAFQASVPLSRDRANFMLKLLEARLNMLKNELRL